MKPIKTTKTSLVDKIILNHSTAIGLPAGFSLQVSNLPVGLVIPEASPVTVATNGVRELCKFAKVLDFTNNKITVLQETNPFQVGDIIMAGKGTKAYTITAVTVNATHSDRVDITTGTAIDDPTEAAQDGFIYLATAESASAGARKQKADVIMKFHAVVDGNNYILFDQAAYTQVVQLEAGFVAPEFLADLAGYAIREIKY